MADPDADAVEDFVRRRADALRARFGDQGGPNDQALDDLLISLDRGDRFRDSAADILKSLQLGTQAGLDQQMDIAVNLLDAKMCQAVTIDTRQDWDTHSMNVAQHASYDATFEGLSRLMANLQAKNMLDDTVVAVISEMTRTPLRNAGEGKDHWGHTSAMLIGAVRGNARSGGTDDSLESMLMDLQTGELDEGGDYCKYDDFCAGLLELVDVDPGDWLPGVVPFRGAHPS
jgi:uncharacterized protein (DUF1501 family)